MTEALDYVEIALSGPFTSDVIDVLPDEPEVDVGLSSGFGGERVVKFVFKIGPAAIAAMRRLMTALTGADRVVNVKITRKSVEIGGLRAADMPAAKELILDVLDRLDPPEPARTAKAKAAKP